jgi:hypothetical protein
MVYGTLTNMYDPTPIKMEPPPPRQAPFLDDHRRRRSHRPAQPTTVHFFVQISCGPAAPPDRPDHHDHDPRARMVSHALPMATICPCSEIPLFSLTADRTMTVAQAPRLNCRSGTAAPLPEHPSVGTRCNFLSTLTIFPNLEYNPPRLLQPARNNHHDPSSRRRRTTSPSIRPSPTRRSPPFSAPSGPTVTTPRRGFAPRMRMAQC